MTRTNATAQDADRFVPFADGTGVRSIGGLSIENGPHAIALHGSLDIPRDREGLALARRLRETFAAIERVLEGSGLPETLADTGAGEPDDPPRTVRNPFA